MNMHLKKPNLIQDFIRALKSIHVSYYFGMLEIRRRYIGTMIGPFWTTLGLLAFTLTVGVVASGLWKSDLESFILFFSSGIIIWASYSAIINESGTMYMMGKSIISDDSFNYMQLPMINVIRNLIVLTHNFVLYAFFCLIFGYLPDLLNLLFIIPGLFLMALHGVWISVFLGMFVSRYKDVQQIVTISTQVAMFVTPIFWEPDRLEDMRRTVFVDFNPLYHIVEVVRSPLLGVVPSIEIYLANIIILVCGFSVSFIMYRLYKHRIIFWI